MSERRNLTAEFWRELGHLLPPRAVVLDLGAHLLEEASQLLPHLEVARWIAVEADPALADTCRRLAPSLAPRGKMIEIYNLAVARENGATTLYRSRKKDGQAWTASSSTKRPTGVLDGYPWLDFRPEDQIRVPCRTLDTICRDVRVGEKIDFLKMDIQGAEIDAVLGGQETFASTKYVLTEVVEGREEYEGQAGLDGLVRAMPGKWRVVERLLCDALLERVT